MQQSNKNRFIPIGLMLFALFFGAGNLIFPASMGQAAGDKVWWALLGFCITGVGLPLIAVMQSDILENSVFNMWQSVFIRHLRFSTL